MATVQQIEAVKRAVILTVWGGSDVGIGLTNGSYVFITPDRMKSAGVDECVRVRDGVLEIRAHDDWDWSPVEYSGLIALANSVHAVGWQ